jgi:hypothetical protein
MAGPGIRHGRAIHEPTSHLDVLPTVLARLGLQGGAGTEAPGRDFLSDPPDPAYVPLIMVQRRGHSRDQIAFVGSEGRFGVRLFRDRKEIRFLGALDEAGRPRPEPVDANGERVFLSWFRDFLSRNSLPGGSSRASAATRHTSGRKSGT